MFQNYQKEFHGGKKKKTCTSKTGEMSGNKADIGSLLNAAAIIYFNSKDE